MPKSSKEILTEIKSYIEETDDSEKVKFLLEPDKYTCHKKAKKKVQKISVSPLISLLITGNSTYFNDVIKKVQPADLRKHFNAYLFKNKDIKWCGFGLWTYSNKKCGRINNASTARLVQDLLSIRDDDESYNSNLSDFLKIQDGDNNRDTILSVVIRGNLPKSKRNDSKDYEDKEYILKEVSEDEKIKIIDNLHNLDFWDKEFSTTIFDPEVEEKASIKVKYINLITDPKFKKTTLNKVKKDEKELRKHLENLGAKTYEEVLDHDKSAEFVSDNDSELSKQSAEIDTNDLQSLPEPLKQEIEEEEIKINNKREPDPEDNQIEENNASPTKRQKTEINLNEQASVLIRKLETDATPSKDEIIELIRKLADYSTKESAPPTLSPESAAEIYLKKYYNLQAEVTEDFEDGISLKTDNSNLIGLWGEEAIYQFFKHKYLYLYKKSPSDLEYQKLGFKLNNCTKDITWQDKKIKITFDINVDFQNAEKYGQYLNDPHKKTNAGKGPYDLVITKTLTKQSPDYDKWNNARKKTSYKEVKTTTSQDRSSVNFTANEFEFMKRNLCNYRIYAISNAGRTATTLERYRPIDLVDIKEVKINDAIADINIKAPKKVGKTTKERGYTYPSGRFFKKSDDDKAGIEIENKSPQLSGHQLIKN